jgi:N-acyl-D-aspartate/D-glutamate deacylase
VLSAGLPWAWESFGDYLDFLDGRSFDLDVATQVPHAALRVYVMGERGANREPATEVDRLEMARLAVEGVRAGALGFSTSRTLNHRTVDGRLIPTLDADEAELGAIADGLGGIDSGWIQVISDFKALDEEFAMLRRLTERARRPLAITVLQRDAEPMAWRTLLDHIGDARAEGLPMLGQVISRPTGVLLGFELSLNPFVGRPSWDAIAALPFAEKLERLRDPEFRKQLIGERNPRKGLAVRVESWERIFPFGDPPEYEPAPEQSIAAIAAREQRAPNDVAYDLLLENDGKAILYRPLSNYANGDLEPVREMLTDPSTLVSLGDGGAHVGVLSDASAITYLLTHWTRDRSRGDTLPIAWAIKRLTSDNARAIGLSDRGVLAEGFKADINLIDYDSLKLRSPEVAYDFPDNGKRLVQRIEGYRATMVSGCIVHRDGEPTGHSPGRLIRGTR